MEQAGVEATTREQGRGREFELLVSAISDYAIFLLDVEGHVLTWNTGAERTKGYRAEEIIGQHFSRFYPADQRNARVPDEALRTAAREGRFEGEGWRLRKDGSRFWANVVITALHDETGQLIGFGKVTRELTARRMSEEQLRAAVAELRTVNAELVQFRRLVVSVRDYAIFMLDPGGYVATWNAGAENIKGYRAEDIIGRHFSTFYTAEDRLRGHPADELTIAARDGRFEEEGWRIRKDGGRFWANVVITAVRDEHGVLTGFAKVTRDLTARRAAEEELRAAQERLRRSNVELARYAAVAAHDLREPLETVSGFVQLLADTEAERISESGHETLEQISGSVERMQRLVQDLLLYASLDEQPVPQRVDLAASVDRVLRALHGQISGRGAIVEVDVPGGAAVSADPLGVDLLLQNLISNAVKFGRTGCPAVAIAARREPAGWHVTVTDNGAGVAPDEQERIFTAFERLGTPRSVPGTGLGLAICSRVIERAGGGLGLDSSPGEGSSFWFELPAAA